MALDPATTKLGNILGVRLSPMLMSRMTTPLGMDSYNDSTVIMEGMVQYAQNMRMLKDVTYTREGWSKYNNTEMPTSSGVFGLGYYHPDVDTSLVLAVSDGKLYSGDAGTMTERASGLNATNLCSIVQTQDVALIIDQESGILAYKYGQTPYFAGVNTPQQYRLISSFEVDEPWGVNGGTQTADEGHRVHGKQSIRFLSNDNATMGVYYTLPSALNLSTFPDGSASSTNDYIRIYLLRGDPDDFTSCTIYLGDSDFSNCYYYVLSGATEWTTETRDYVAFDFKIRKSLFSTTGSPNWNNITTVKIVTVAAGAGHSPAITLDYFTLFKSGPTAADAGVGSIGAGDYYYKMTFLTADEEESEASLESSPVVTIAANHNITVSNLPISGSDRIVRRRLYRIGGTNTEWKLVYQFEDNVQTTYTDSTVDSDLGDVLVDVSGIPYIPKAICVHGNYVIIANLTSQDGLYYPDGVMVSEEGSYEIYDVLKFFTMEEDSGMQIKWLHSEFGRVWAGKEDAIWSFDPANLDIPPRCESRIYSGIGMHAVCSGDNCFYYVDRYGVIRCDGASHTEISGPVRNYLDQVPTEWLKSIWIRYFDNTLYIGIPLRLEGYHVITSTGDRVYDAADEEVIESQMVVSNFILVHHIPSKRWYTFVGWDVRTAATSSHPIFGRHLYLGHNSTGYIYDALTGDNDDGTPIESILWLKDSDFGEPETLKDYSKVYLTGAKMTATDVPLTITPYLDRADSGLVVNTSVAVITSETHTRLELPMPEMGAGGTYLGMKIVATERWKLRSLVQIARPREETH